MKKGLILLAIAFVVGVLLIGASKASAAVVCDHPDHPIWSVDTTTKVGCISDADWKRAEEERAHRDNPNNVLWFSTGSSVTLKDGRIETCPWWFPFTMGCVVPKVLLK